MKHCNNRGKIISYKERNPLKNFYQHSEHKIYTDPIIYETSERNGHETKKKKKKKKKKNTHVKEQKRRTSIAWNFVVIVDRGIDIRHLFNRPDKRT